LQASDVQIRPQSAPAALFEGVPGDGCTKLTEHGAEYLTNDGYSATDYYPVGTWYAYRDSSVRDGFLIGGEVGPDVLGTALYSVSADDITSLRGAATLNRQADQAAQIEAYRDTWRDYTGLYPALSRWDPAHANATQRAGSERLVPGLAACFGDGRVIDENQVAKT